MSLNSGKSAPYKSQMSEQKTTKAIFWISLLIATVILYWFYGIVPRYGPARDQSAFDWIIYKSAISGSDYRGYLVILLGTLLYIVSYRTLQPRVAMGALPFILLGSSWVLWGWQVAKMLAFPLFFFWLAIPLPGFQQATTHLQLLATSMAHHGSGLFGVETYVEGTKVLPIKGNWEPLDIAAGCSGIRSLMALLMISAAWAYIAKMALWKKVFLFLMAFPLAILGNALRVISIFVIAEYGDAKWAAGTWHDWSGLLLFYPFSLLILLMLHSLLEGGLPWKKASQRQLRRVSVTRSDVSKSVISEL